MSFRTKLFLLFLVTVLASVSAVSYSVTHYTQAAYEEADAHRTQALVEQFQKEFAQQRELVVRQVENITNAEVTLKMAIDIERPNADQSIYVHDAAGAAQEHGLNFMEFVLADGTLISSAQYPARVGYKETWVTDGKDWSGTEAFLRREELPNEVAVALLAVRTQPEVKQPFYAVGGRRLDKNFLASLVAPAGMRTLLYLNLDQAFLATDVTSATGEVEQPERFAPMIAQLQKQPTPLVQTIQWNSSAESAEVFHVLPLTGRNGELLGALLVGSSRGDIVLLTRHIMKISAVVAAAAILVGLLVTFWVSARITRPIEELAEGAREVAAGHWDTRINLRGRDETGQLASAFNHMTQTLASQRERLVQTERVAAWRELARRLAHELRNPLFPLQITVENMQRAQRLSHDQFLEVFNESTATLKAELANLNSIVNRFSDFSKMPPPEFSRVDINEVIRSAVTAVRTAIPRSRQADHRHGIFPERGIAGNRWGSGIAAQSVSESGAERTRRHARRRDAEFSHSGDAARRAYRSFGYRQGADSGRMLAAVYAVLHDQTAGNRAGAGDRAVGGQRSPRHDFGG